MERNFAECLGERPYGKSIAQKRISIIGGGLLFASSLLGACSTPQENTGPKPEKKATYPAPTEL